jgi:hypothetical protein
MVDYDKLILTRREMIALCKLSRAGTLPKDQVYHFEYLYDNDLVELLDSESETDGFGFPLPSDMCSVTDFYRRYAIYHRRSFRWRYITPVTVSIATTTVLYMSRHWLLPVIQWFLSRLPGFHP